MKKASKKYVEASKKIEKNKEYSVEEKIRPLHCWGLLHR